MLKGRKQCFVIFFDHSEKKITSKNSFLEVFKMLKLFVKIFTTDDKYSLSVKASVSRNQIKCNYIRTKKNFLNFFCISGISIKFWKISKKGWASEVISYWNYRHEKGQLLKCPKNSVSERLWTVNMLNGPKHCLNPHDSIFVIFFDHSQRISAPKTFFQKYLKSWDCLLTYWHPMTCIFSK